MYIRIQMITMILPKHVPKKGHACTWPVCLLTGTETDVVILTDALSMDAHSEQTHQKTRLQTLQY